MMYFIAHEGPLYLQNKNILLNYPHRYVKLIVKFYLAIIILISAMQRVDKIR
jgi:hypothetical protein